MKFALLTLKEYPIVIVIKMKQPVCNANKTIIFLKTFVSTLILQSKLMDVSFIKISWSVSNVKLVIC